MMDLGGHDFGELIRAMETSKLSKKKPTLIVAHTVKGWGLECIAVGGNHSTLPNDEEIQSLRKAQGVPESDVFAPFAKNSDEAKFLKARGEEIWNGYKEQLALRERNKKKFATNVPETLAINLKMVPIVHTQWMLGQLAAKLTRIANSSTDEKKLKPGQKPLTPDELRWKPASELLVTMAPDVGTSTNLNPTMDGKVFGPDNVEDFESEYSVKDSKSPDIVPGEEVSSPPLAI